MRRLILFCALVVLLYLYSIQAGYLPQNLSLQNLWQRDMTRQSASQISSEQAIIKAVESAAPSVVTVSITKHVRSQDQLQFDPNNPLSPFSIQPGKEQEVEGNIGSGFIVSDKGIIVTNRHVVSDTQASYTVILQDGTSYDTQRIVRDPLNDLAIVKIVPKGTLKPLPLADSDKLKLGQMAIAIGTPLGEFRNTVTTGIVSGLGRGITAGSAYEGYVERLDNVIQTDAAINPGNSGGPLLNSSGEVIGVNAAVSQEGQNIGFAIPVNVVKDLLENYDTSNGTITRPFLGVRYQIIDREMAITERVPSGAYVREVIEGASAQQAGIQAGDIITDINGKRISKEDDLSAAIEGKKVGDTVKLTVWRDGKSSEVAVTLVAYE